MIRTCWRLLLVVPVCALTAGCLTMSPEEMAQRDNNRCVARGYKPGTPDFNACLNRVANEADSRLQAAQREAAERDGIPPSNRGY